MINRIRLAGFSVCCALFMLLAYCMPASAASKTLILATTTSTQDSGLLDVGGVMTVSAPGQSVLLTNSGNHFGSLFIRGGFSSVGSFRSIAKKPAQAAVVLNSKKTPK